MAERRQIPRDPGSKRLTWPSKRTGKCHLANNYLAIHHVPKNVIRAFSPRVRLIRKTSQLHANAYRLCRVSALSTKRACMLPNRNGKGRGGKSI